jgi:hypothetical protein
MPGHQSGQVNARTPPTTMTKRVRRVDFRSFAMFIGAETCLIQDYLTLPFLTHRFVPAVLADMNKIYFMTHVCWMCDGLRSKTKRQVCVLASSTCSVLIWCHVSIVFYFFFYQLFAVSIRSPVHSALTFS